MHKKYYADLKRCLTIISTKHTWMIIIIEWYWYETAIDANGKKEANEKERVRKWWEKGEKEKEKKSEKKTKQIDSRILARRVDKEHFFTVQFKNKIWQSFTYQLMQILVITATNTCINT